MEGDPQLVREPQDWQFVRPRGGRGSHLLFYFRDQTFECVAQQCIIEPTADNALYRADKMVGSSTEG